MLSKPACCVAAAAAAVALQSRHPREQRPAACEVRLWGPKGTQGKGAAQLLAEKAKARQRDPWEGGATHLQEAAALAKAGPLYSQLPEAPCETEWARLGGLLAVRLTGRPEAETLLPSALGPALAKRIYHLYLPLYFWMRTLVIQSRAAREAGTPGAVVIGISAPQGCGKTTAVELLKELFAADGLSCVSLSLDDFYLPGQIQELIADLNEGNDLLELRGNAGTHEVQLGVRTLAALKSAEADKVSLPSYDKAANGGRGDRRPASEWSSQEVPCDVVLYEGWMVGFKPSKDSAALAKIHPGLPSVNQRLTNYQALDDLVDGWCVISTADLSQVFKWRLEAEKAMAAMGRPGMTDAQVHDFVQRYMPAYKAYTPELVKAAESKGIDGKPTLLLQVSASRLPIRRVE